MLDPLGSSSKSFQQSRFSDDLGYEDDLRADLESSRIRNRAYIQAYDKASQWGQQQQPMRQQAPQGSSFGRELATTAVGAAVSAGIALI